VIGSLGIWAAVCLTDHPGWLHATLNTLGVFALVGGLLRPEPVETAAFRSAWHFASPVYVGGLLSCVDLLPGLPRGGAWVLLSMFLAWLSDTFAYFTGRAFGKTKLYPRLSPKKTVEGSLGGLVGAICGAVASTFWLPIPLFDAVVLAIVANLAGQAGDLFESLLKRSVGVKDSGTLLPGHGGMLDRVDALMYTAAITWLYASQVLPVR
jgi:phosphatidate cytidylyltransferase